MSPLPNATYRRLFGAQVIALVGTGLTTMALMLLAYDLADENAGAVVGIALALKMVVYVVGEPAIVALGLAAVAVALAATQERRSALS